MRRLIPLCLLGLLSIALVPTADAATGRRESHAAGSKSAKASTPNRTAAARPAAQPQRSASRQSAASVRSAKARPAQILRKGKVQRTASRVAQRPAAGPRLTSWQAGLPAAAGEQRECPVGTMSTLARGHDDVVRCLPL
ncbi:hypothetical protein QMO56_00485 [Roseomonas sp. E05]|uniref:hypothetical protein n=1 Tax=Roseomonas sp. E05 TaxID=3046310 RepID=UPI0024B8E0FF|nr:hypothetical protein [Roseomonas sp. E05]MDJ0386573.1 hypothetical protein [Roseomonas sp. E05]